MILLCINHGRQLPVCACVCGCVVVYMDVMSGVRVCMYVYDGMVLILLTRIVYMVFSYIGGL